ncbi:MAG: DUF4430 domain-containing protein [Pirellulaceae bacterium]
MNRRPLLGIARLLGLIMLLAGWHAAASADEPQTPPKTVRLVVDYGDGVEKHFTALAWKEGMTVLDALVAAQKHPRGIKFVYRGKEATAFLTQIDELENEGRGKNWIFRVNDEMASQSFAIFAVKAGDTVLWKFGEYR